MCQHELMCIGAQGVLKTDPLDQESEVNAPELELQAVVSLVYTPGTKAWS